MGNSILNNILQVESEEEMTPQEAWDSLREKFTASSGMRIEQTTITREEYGALLVGQYEIFQAVKELPLRILDNLANCIKGD